MRDLASNSRYLWYAEYVGETMEEDENGDLTGERVPEYTEPIRFKANLSATRGTQGFTGTGSSYDYFGADVKYDLIISTANMHLPINEHCIVWTEPPVTKQDGLIDYDKAGFRVTAVARGIHHMKYAIRSRQQNDLE